MATVSVQHGVSCLLARKGVKQFGLFCLLWIPVCDVDYEDVHQVDKGSDHHKGKGEAEACSSLAGPLALLPVLVEKHVMSELQVELDNPGDEGAHCRQQGQAIPQI